MVTIYTIQYDIVYSIFNAPNKVSHYYTERHTFAFNKDIVYGKKGNQISIE